MPPIDLDQRLVVALSSRALFELEEEDRLFEEQGNEAYRTYQRLHQNEPLAPGVAFPFIRRLLSLNLEFPENPPVEVVLLSRNDPDTGLRVLSSIQHHGLEITRGAFLSGKSPYSYVSAYGACLFLSANPQDVRLAMDAGVPAGLVLRSSFQDDESRELRIAFDFDGVLADDEAEKVYQEHKDLGEFTRSEQLKKSLAHNPGPLSELFRKLAGIQRLEMAKEVAAPAGQPYQRILRTAIITARSSPSHERVVTTLREWGVMADETFFMGGVEKRRILQVLRPHIFFDDQPLHLAPDVAPSVHVPFGVANQKRLP